MNPFANNLSPFRRLGGVQDVRKDWKNDLNTTEAVHDVFD